MADRSFGVGLPTGIEGDVIRNCGFVRIKELFTVGVGVPAGEVVTRTGGIRDGFQFVCLGTNDFFGLINRHLRVVGLAAIGIKGHMAEAKKIAIFQYIIAFKLFCGVPVVVEVDGTIFGRLLCKSSRATNQTVFERSQSSRERNVFQIEAPSKGIRFNGFYFFWDGDVRQMLAICKGIATDLLNILT